ncbi:putative holin [Pectobacterium polaris]|uniref:putative holin n=1 Tax=Pectobacterium polaris TaxID=2042057 RepID=UPI000F8D1140|nr:membrane protein [Pectobacterium polaris]
MNIFYNKIFRIARVKRLLGWQLTSILLFVLIGLVSSRQLYVVIYKISLNHYSMQEIDALQAVLFCEGLSKVTRGELPMAANHHWRVED